MAEELKACPFCSCKDIGEVTINPRLEPRHRRFKAYCKVCQCRTSEHKTRKEARIYWNTRALHKPAAVEVVEVVAVVKHDSPLPGYTDFMKYEAWMADGLSDGWQPLMTVAQHNRIMAAAPPPDSRVVPVELLELLERVIGCIDAMGWDQLEADIRALLEVKP